MKKRLLIVWDIDQTLALDNHRVPKVKPPEIDLETFFKKLMNPKKVIKDKVIPESLIIQRALVPVWNEHFDIYTAIVTARGESLREITKEWLEKRAIAYSALYMRPEILKLKASTEIKKPVLEKLIELHKPHYKIVFDDDYTGDMESTYQELGFVMYKVIHKDTPKRFKNV